MADVVGRTTTSGPALREPAVASLVAVVVAHARTHPADVAMRRYQLGRWREHRWGDVAIAIAAVATALRAAGVDAGDRVAILSSNRPEWLEADLAVQSLGAVTVGLDPAWPDGHLRSVLSQTGCGAIVVEDAEQLARASAARSSCPALARAVVIDDRNLSVSGDHVALWSAIIEAAAVSADPVAELEGAAAGLKPDDPAVVIPPVPGLGEQAAVFSHRALVTAGASLGQALDLDPSDELVAHVPLADLRGRVATLTAPTLARAIVNYGIGGSSFGTDLRLAQPTVLFAEPVVWEVMRAEVERRMGDASRLKRTTYEWARRSAKRRPRGANGGGRLRARFGDAALLRKLGLRRLRLALAGDGPLTDDTATFFAGLGARLITSLSNVESGGFVALVDADAARSSDHVPARLVPGLEATVDAGGRLLTRGPASFLGYAGTGPSGGWVPTGRSAILGTDGVVTFTDAPSVADGDTVGDLQGSRP